MALVAVVFFDTKDMILEGLCWGDCFCTAAWTMSHKTSTFQLEAYLRDKNLIYRKNANPI
jgi:hypothetical protein